MPVVAANRIGEEARQEDGDQTEERGPGQKEEAQFYPHVLHADLSGDSACGRSQHEGSRERVDGHKDPGLYYGETQPVNGRD